MVAVPTAAAPFAEGVVELRPVILLNDVPVATPIDGVVSTGEVKVLFVKVSVVALPTKVSVLVGNVSVPVLTIVEITGDVKVLLVSVTEFVGVTVGVAHSNPVAVALFTVKTIPFDPPTVN